MPEPVLGFGETLLVMTRALVGIAPNSREPRHKSLPQSDLSVYVARVLTGIPLCKSSHYYPTRSARRMLFGRPLFHLPAPSISDQAITSKVLSRRLPPPEEKLICPPATLCMQMVAKDPLLGFWVLNHHTFAVLFIFRIGNFRFENTGLSHFEVF